MSSNVADYVALITSWHATRPNFVSTVAATAQPVADVQGALSSLPSAFDIDVAVGVQLDHIGERVGLSRYVPVPLAGLFFSFDDVKRGFDTGIWKGPYDTAAGISRLDDDTYRRLLRSKIAANSWDGTVAGAQAALNVFFSDPSTNVFIQDNGIAIAQSLPFALDRPMQGFDQGVWAAPEALNMSITIGVSGKLPSLVDLAILGNDLIPIKPAGVEVDYAVTSVDGSSVFGFDVSNQFIAGFDTGAWGVSPAYEIAQL